MSFVGHVLFILLPKVVVRYTGQRAARKGGPYCDRITTSVDIISAIVA